MPSALFVFIVGSIVGSFLNVCIYRLPREKSIVSPRSHCPHCKKSIGWYDNVPFLSYLFLKGRCRFCHKRISFQYVLVEGITALAFLVVYLNFGLSGRSLIYAGWFGALIAASFIDLEHQIIPDEISLGGLAVGLLVSVFYPPLHQVSGWWPSLWRSAVGAFVGGGSIYLIGLVGNFIFKKESMGGGDVKLLAMIGSVLGWKMTLLTFFIAPFFGSVVGIILKIREGAEIIPYGPFLSLGSIVALLWGEVILTYLGFR